MHVKEHISVGWVVFLSYYLKLPFFVCPIVTEETFCEHETAVLLCPPGEVIEVTSAVYGRPRDDVCLGATNNSSLDCIHDRTANFEEL